jgi:hypothetical protein
MTKHQAALALFAVALGVVIAVAFVTTLERVSVHQASNSAVPGTTGLAKPHPQLDRAPGEPLKDR